MPIRLRVNGREIDVPDAKSDMPLLWFVREELNLKGTKFGCGVGQCGACMVHFKGDAVPSCMMTCAQAASAEITTIEGLADGGRLHPVQEAWIEADVPQCGYCQAGQIMTAAALLRRIPTPTDTDIDVAMTNLCRCGTYVRIRDAIKRAANNMRPAAEA